MKFKLLIVALAASSLAVANTAASQAPTAEFSPAAFRAHVDFLADDLLEGREAGSRGHEIAARYVAAQFESLGLEPGSGDGWYQPIAFVRVTHRGTPRLSIGGRTFEHGREMLVRPNVDGEPVALDAPLLFAGYGLDLPERGYDDYAGLDARGRVVVVLHGTAGGTPSDVAAHLNAEKARMAAARGAVGLIVVRAGPTAEGSAWPGLVRNSDRPATTWVDADSRPFSTHGLRFNASVDRPVGEALLAGATRSLERVLRDTRDGGTPRGFALPGTVRIETEGADLTRFTSPNVIALLPGSDPALAGEPVLLMAHLDHIGVDPTPEGADAIRNGAMDNASGVATLIEVARQLVRPGNRPRRPILFAAVTAEEVGLLGAQYLARNPVLPGRIAGVVNLDMPILTYDFQDVIAFGAEHSTLGPIVARAAARMNVRVSPDPLPQEGLFTRSDHYEFVRIGVPSVFLMTGFEGEGRERFTGFLEHDYHRPSDDAALPFDWDAGAKFAQLNYLIAREIADAPAPPVWNADGFFGAAARQQAAAPAGTQVDEARARQAASRRAPISR